MSSVYVFSYFPFGFEGRIWDLIVSVPDHCLSFYFTDNEWISNKHMLAVSNILRKQFPQINGQQDTQNTHLFSWKKNSFGIHLNSLIKTRVSPSVQLHFDGINHWTMSFSSSKDGESICYIDSLCANLKDLKNNVKIQLSQIDL